MFWVMRVLHYYNIVFTDLKTILITVEKKVKISRLQILA